MINIDEIRNLYDEGVATKEAAKAAEKDARLQNTINNIGVFEDEIRKRASNGEYDCCFYEDDNDYDLYFLRDYFRNAGFSTYVDYSEYDGEVWLEVSWKRKEPESCTAKRGSTLSRLLRKIFN